MNDNSIGQKGENFCAGYYSEHGYTVIERNFHSRFGEIDVIAQNETTLVFIEVKTRSEDSLISGAECVGEAKQKKCILTALTFLQSHQPDLNVRFDVFEVIHNNGKLKKFRKIESAFDIDESRLKDIYY